MDPSVSEESDLSKGNDHSQKKKLQDRCDGKAMAAKSEQGRVFFYAVTDC